MCNEDSSDEDRGSVITEKISGKSRDNNRKVLKKLLREKWTTKTGDTSMDESFFRRLILCIYSDEES